MKRAAVAHQAYLIDGKSIPYWNGEYFHFLARDFYLNVKLHSLDSLLVNNTY
jgi:hypothetical protein